MLGWGPHDQWSSVAGKFVLRHQLARHLKTTDDLFDTLDSPRTTSMVAAAVQWAERAEGR